MSKKQSWVSAVIFLSVIFLPGCLRPDEDVRRAGQYAARSQELHKAARGLYERALAAHPPASEALEIRLAWARLEMESGEYARAIEVLTDVDAKEAGALLAVAYFKNGDFTRALEVFNRLGATGSAEYIYYYGMTLEKSNLYDQALRVYALITQDPVFKPKAEERCRAINLAIPKAAFEGLDETVKKLIQESPSQKEYPEASGLYLLADEDILLTDDMRLETSLHYCVKVLNDRGKEKFAEVVLTYDSTYEKLTLEYARTIKPDGTVVSVGDKNIRDVSLYMNFPLYSNARARIISMPEVSAGSVIEYKARLSRAQLPNKKDFDTVYWLQMDDPILWQRSTISVPKERQLYHKIINGQYNTFGFDMAPKVTEEGDRRIYRLEFRNVPQIIPEPLMPPLSRVNPYVLLSSFASWQDIYAWWRALYQDKTAFDADIRAKAEALTKDKKTRREKTRAIYNFCAQDVRYVAVEYGDAGYEPHEAVEIFKNKYGDCKDKAILLISMLAAVGIEAYPVLIATADSYEVERDVPALLFNHAIAAVDSDGETVFMDPTAETASFGDLPPGDEDRLVLLFRPDRYELVKTPLFGPEHNRITTRMTMRLNKDEGIGVERRVETQGAYQQAQRYWLKFTMPALIEEALKQKSRAIAPQAVLKNHAIKNVENLDAPVLLEYAFDAPEYLVRAGRERIVNQFGGVDTAAVSRAARRYPIDHGSLETTEETIEVELPPHLEVKYLPEPVRVENKWFDIEGRYERQAGRKIFYRWLFRTKSKTVAVAEYEAYKKAVEQAASLLNQHMVLKEK